MAVTYQNKSETKVTFSNASCTAPIPTGFSAGDLLIAQVMVSDDHEHLITPAGWTLIQEYSISNVVLLSIVYRIAEAGDTNWTWSLDGATGNWYIAILRYTGQHATPIHASSIVGNATASPTAPSVAYTGLESGSLAIQSMGADGSRTPYTTPSALTERYNDDTGATGGSGGDKAISGTGSTGTAVFTIAASDQWIAGTAVIAAAAGATSVKPAWYYDLLRRRNN